MEEQYSDNNYIPRDMPLDMFPDPMQFGATHQNNQTASIMEKADPSIVLERIKHQLRAEIFDEEKNAWVRPEGQEPLVNEKGVSKLCTLFESLVNYNTTLSNLDSAKEVSDIAGAFADTLRKAILLNYREWNIKIEDADTILITVFIPALMSLKRCWKQGDRMFFGTTHQSREIIRANEIGKKKNFMEFMGSLR